jgi:hypothetical protein
MEKVKISLDKDTIKYLLDAHGIEGLGIYAYYLSMAESSINPEFETAYDLRLEQERVNEIVEFCDNVL